MLRGRHRTGPTAPARADEEATQLLEGYAVSEGCSEQPSGGGSRFPIGLRSGQGRLRRAAMVPQ